jgi:hypothetical protein
MVCLFGTLGFSQTNELSNLRQKTFSEPADRLMLDSLTILPASVSIFNRYGARVDSTFYELTGNELIRQKPVPDAFFPVTVSYRVLPFDLGRSLSRLDTAQMRKAEDGTIIGLDYNPYEREEKLLDFRGLDYSGSFARGISFGNNQDLVLNSSFNLQLAGDLGDGVEILAAITDENIPLQPEGNTQQLREFDKIFIQLKKGDSRLTAGDYELQRPNSYFMNYFKKLQGATFSNQTSLFDRGTLRTSLGAAISRGKFARNLITQQEGNQGPYKLRGSEGERFIIVLAGTEKVWLDGQPLRRGLEEDYVIDYNRGELSFTNRRMITKDSRIIVEFEYSAQSYLRSMYVLNTEYEENKFRLYFNLFSQQDSRTSTGDRPLSDLEKRILREAGDDLSQAIAPSIDTLEEFSSTRTTYRLVDTVITCGAGQVPFQVLQYSTGSDRPIYTARFSFVGPGNGNYILDSETIANERVYKWVAPDSVSCRPRGDYEPVVQLVAPQQQRLITAGGAYKLGKTAGLQAEVALSHNDLNRFSPLDSDDNQGLAAYTTFRKDFRLGPDSSSWSLATELSYEFVQETFRALNPYRDPEFLRDWNIANIQGVGVAPQATEQLGRSVFTLQKPGLGSLQYSFSGFLRDSLYTGIRHAARLLINAKGWEVDGQGSLLSTDETDRRTRFFRPSMSLSRTFRRLGDLRLGLNGEREKSDRYSGISDTLSAASFFYDRYRVFLESPERERYNFGVNYSRRIDYAPVDNEFRQSTVAGELNVNGAWRLKKNLQLTGNFTYRQLQISDPKLTEQEPAETFLGRTDVNFNIIKGVVRSLTTYEIGSGQEPKLEFTYVKVNQGEGTHVWLDSLFNNDGKIQPNEMEVAPFADLADFIRIATFTDEFIRTNNVGLNQSLQISPRAVWFNAKGLRNFLGRFSTQSTLKITRKTQQAPGVSSWDPFQLNIADSALVSVSSNIRNIFFFNRADPAYDLQAGQSDNRSRVVQTSGFESRRSTEAFVRGRWNVARTLSLQGAVTRGERSSDSQFFDNKDYRIEFWKVEPQFTFLPVKTFRTIFRYKFQRDQNTLSEGGEVSLQHDLGLEATFNQSAKSSLRLRFNYVNIDFKGQANSPVGFAMLNGLQNGRNFLWNLSLDRQLAKNIQLNLSYEGRKTGTASMVHVGRAQVAATF